MSTSLRHQIEETAAAIADDDARLAASWGVFKQAGGAAAKRKLIAGGAALAVGLLLRQGTRSAVARRAGWRRYGRFAAPLLKAGLPVLLPLLTPLLDRRATSLLSRVGLPVGGPVDPPLQTVDALPAAHWEGTWHEWAYLPTREHHDTDVRWSLLPVPPQTTEAALAPPPSWDILVEGIDSTGQERRSQGRCRQPDPARPGALKTTFAAPALQWMPLVWHDEAVLHVAPGGDVLVIGTPDRQRLWLLGRSPRVDEARWSALLQLAAGQGFEVQRLQRAASPAVAPDQVPAAPLPQATGAESDFLPNAVPRGVPAAGAQTPPR